MAESLLTGLPAETPSFTLLFCSPGVDAYALVAKEGIPAVEQLLKDLPFVGFSTYGEQFNGIHVNQTLTGVAIGGCHP